MGTDWSQESLPPTALNVLIAYKNLSHNDNSLEVEINAW